MQTIDEDSCDRTLGHAGPCGAPDCWLLREQPTSACPHEGETVIRVCLDCEDWWPLPDSIVLLDIISVADIRTLMGRLLGPDHPSDAETEGAFRRLFESLPPLEVVT